MIDTVTHAKRQSVASCTDAAVAVLVATANRPELLDRALRSVERQTFAPARIVVVDDSPDLSAGKRGVAARFKSSTEQVVKRHPAVDYLRNSRSKGAAGAWNEGLDHLLRITSDPRHIYVAILDDDDEWEPDHLQTCFQVAVGGQFDMVAAPLWRHEEGVRPTQRFPPKSLSAADFLVGNPNIQGSNLFCRLSVLLEAGLFDEWLPSCTDRDLCIRIADLPRVLFGRSEKTTVHHYASRSYDRLSTPGSWAKGEGLSRFYAKYRGRMSAGQQTAFRERAARLFGWHERAPNRTEATSPNALIDSASRGGDGAPPHLIVGTIADTSSLDDLAHLLRDLRGVVGHSELSELAGLEVVVLENGDNRHASQKLRDLAESERKVGLRIALVDRAKHAEDTKAGRVLDGGVSEGRRLPISTARTVLQSYLYAFAEPLPGAIVWIVDDDLRLDPLVANSHGQLQRQPLALLPALRKLQALRDSGVADVVIGRCTGDAPVPFAATVRTQLVDLVASLMWLAALSPYEVLPDRARENAALRQNRRDYYYDLSRRETDRLETPFWVTPKYGGELVGEVFERLADRAERILAGEQLFRPLVAQTETDQLILSQGLQRGGNTFVLDIETLRLAPNPSPMIHGRRTRRSDMMWALLQERYLGRKVVTVPLALRQDRSGIALGGLDVGKVMDDMRGYALFSALDAVPEVFASVDDLRLRIGSARASARFVSRVRKFLTERLAAFRLSFFRVRGLAGVLRDLADSDALWWREEKYQSARDRLRTFCDRLDESYASNVLAEIEQAVGEIEDSEIKSFLARLPVEIESHRARLSDVSDITHGFKQERVANAKAVVNRLATPRAPLTSLGCGSEGVALTDGKHVYKVFDYWKSWQLGATMDHLHALIGAWQDTRSLYPLLAFNQEGRDAVLTYPFEPSEPYIGGHGLGLVNLLVECRQQGVVCRNIHPNNLRVVDDRVRLIDYGSDVLRLDDDHEFATMCQRAWLSFRHHDRPDLKTLMRQALRQTDLPELAGFHGFYDAVLRMTGERQATEDIALEFVGRPAHVLDYGCGSGKLAKTLADGGVEVLGYDPDRTLRKRWRSTCEGMDNLRFTSRREEVLDGTTFDLVVCQRVLCTIEDDAELNGILADLRAAMAADGRVVLTLCDPHFTFCGPTPEAERELPPGVRYEDTFVWYKTVRTSGRRRRETHRPEEALQEAFARAGLRETRRITVPTVDLVHFMPASDHLAFELVPTDEA